MWLATCEHEDGTFWDDPIAGYIKDEVRMLALRKWSAAPRDTALMLWKCSEHGEITRLAASELQKGASPKEHDRMCAAAAVDISDAGPCTCEPTV